MAHDNLTERLLRAVDKHKSRLAVLMIFILIGAYFLIHSGDSLSPPFRDFCLGIILDIIPVILVFLISYLLWSGIQSIRLRHETVKLVREIADEVRSRLETDELAREIADQVRPDLNFRRSPIRLESRKEFPETLAKFIDGAERVDMLGLSLLGTITECMGAFEAMPPNSIRFLMAKPKSCGSTKSWGSVENIDTGAPDVGADVENALNRLEALIDSGKLEVRLTETAPSFSLTILDPHSDCGIVQVELYCYGIPPAGRPHFRLDPCDQPWYRFFIEQFEAVWDAAEEYTP